MINLKVYVIGICLFTSSALLGEGQVRVNNDIKKRSNDTFAQFLQGDFASYIIKKIKFPVNRNHEGNSLTSFTVKIDSLGRLSLYKFSIKTFPEIQKAFIEVIENSRPWIPATLNNKPVTVFLGLGFRLTFDMSAQTTRANVYRITKNAHLPDNPIYTNCQVRPKFPGGEKSLNDFIRKKYNGPKNNPAIVYFSIVVEKNGRINDVNILRAPSTEIGLEIKRVLSISPRWVPGSQNGKNVRAQFTSFIKIG